MSGRHPQKKEKRHLTKSRLFVRTLRPFLTKNVTHDPSSKHIVIVILSGMHYTFFFSPSTGTLPYSIAAVLFPS